MKKLITVLMLVPFLQGCVLLWNHDCKEKMVLKLEVIIKDVECVKPEKPVFDVLDLDKYIAERTNIKKLTDNYIMLDNYNKQLGSTVDCYYNSLNSIQEEFKK